MNNNSLKTLRKRDYWPDSVTYRVFETFKSPKAGLSRWQLIIHYLKILKYVFTPLAILIPVFSVGSEECEKAGQQKWINIILSTLLVLAIAISLIKIDYFQSFFSITSDSTESIKTISLFYLKYGIAFNLVFIVWLFPFWKNIELFRFVLIETDQIVKNTGALVGDRLWCENNTNKLLKHIIDKAHDERAKWHLINFLANLADEHVEPEGEKWLKLTTTTKANGQWHISRYSKFLSDNIDHAENRILWLVDPIDFYEVLLPDCISYSIAAIAIEELGLPEITWGKTIDLCTVFEPMRKKAEEKYKGKETSVEICNLLRTLREIGLNLPSQGAAYIECGWWDNLNSLFLKNLEGIGNILIASDPSLISKAKISSGFWKLHRHWLDKCFPHIGALLKARVKEAYRIIYIPKVSTGGAPPVESNPDDIAIEQFSKKIWDKLANSYSNSLVEHALNLFEEITGGPDKVKVYVSNTIVTMPDKPEYDLGVYDDNFIVRAKQNDNPRTREVAWYHIDSPTGAGNYPVELTKYLNIIYDPDNTAHELTAEDSAKSYNKFCKLILKHRP